MNARLHEMPVPGLAPSFPLPLPLPTPGLNWVSQAEERYCYSQSQDCHEGSVSFLPFLLHCFVQDIDPSSHSVYSICNCARGELFPSQILCYKYIQTAEPWKIL